MLTQKLLRRIGHDTSGYVQFSRFATSHHLPVFYKKQLLYLRWLVFCDILENWILLSLFDLKVDLGSKLAKMKASENVEGADGPLPRTRGGMINTKNTILVECVIQNSRRLFDILSVW